MLKFYNKKTKNLELYEEKANEKFWDNHWTKNDIKNKIACKNHPLTKYVLDKYLQNKNNKILEAGCGNGHIVYFMNHYGYKNSYGIDYARQTIKTINNISPDLKITKQDIRDTNFCDNYFDIYFSFGVIEHFYDGYSAIIKEAKRIVKPRGYIALSFPYMSPLRKLKVKLNLYPKKEKEENKKNFYEYLLNTNNVLNEFKKYNIHLIEKINYDGIKGFKDEFKLLKPIFQKLYNYRGKSIPINKSKLLLDKIFKNCSSHMIMLILKNE